MKTNHLFICFLYLCFALTAVSKPAISRTGPANGFGRGPQHGGSENKAWSEREPTVDPLGKTEGTVADRDGNIYKTILIGQQTWMAENLRTTKYNDGTSIPLTVEGKEWGNLTTPGFSWYDNAVEDKGAYGALYNWYTVITGKLCPIGWHMPSDAEFSMLAIQLGGAAEAGGKLKESGNIHWQSPNKWATNESGFSALPGGYRDYIGRYFYFGSFGSWWSSTEYFAGSSWSWYVHSSVKDFVRNISGKNDGYSVRCVKDL